MTQLKEICITLDETLIEFFSVLSQIYQEQAKLEQYMRDGFLNLSRARYSMGVKSVSASQLPENEMTPLVMVDIQKEKLEIKFDVRKVDQKTEKENVTTVRKRNTPLSVETIGDSKLNTSEDVSDKSKSIPVDPIKWFGLLVPQALRKSQSSFQEATTFAVNVANLKHKLMNLRVKYKSLLGEKQQLMAVDDL